MSITPVGLVVLPLGVYLFARGHRPLFWATIWTIPFFDTVILHLPFAPVRPFQYLAGLLMVRYAVNVLLQGKEPVVRRSSTVLMAGAFILSLAASLFMPLLLSQKIYVVPEGVSDLWVAYQNPIELRFSPKNFTQMLYPLFGVLLFMTVEWSISKKEDLKRVIKILVRGFYLIAAFMVMYQMAYLLGVRAPIEGLFFLFTGAANAKFSDYNALGSLIRAFTPAGEPGYTGTYFGLVLGFAAGLAYGGYKRGWKLRLNRRLVGLILFALILNASTTGFLAVVIVLLSFVLVSLLRRNSHVKAVSNVKVGVQLIVGVAVVTIVSLVAAQVLGLSLADILISQHLAKITEGAGSGAFRLTTIVYSLENVFAESPILGVGYGSHRTLSLVVFLLANTGIVGLITFLALNATAFTHIVKAMNQARDPELASIAFAIAVAHVSLVAILTIKGDVALTFGWMWVVIGLAEACYRLQRRQSRLRSAKA